MNKALWLSTVAGVLATASCLPKDDETSPMTSGNPSGGGAATMGGAAFGGQSSNTGGLVTGGTTTGGSTTGGSNTNAGGTPATGGTVSTGPDCSDAVVERVAESWDPGNCDGPGLTLGTPRSIGTITLKIADGKNAPMQGVKAQICNNKQCLPKLGVTDASGSISIGTTDGSLVSGVWPTIEYGDGITHTRWGLSPSADSGDIGTIHSLLLPPLETSAAFPELDTTTRKALADGWVHYEDIHLFVAKDSVVKISGIDYPEVAQRGLRTVKVPLDNNAPEGIDKSLGFELVYAATPSNATFCNPARLIVCNSLKWSAGTAVEVFVQSVTPPSFSTVTNQWSQGWAPGPGGWGKVADGVVTADGNLIATTRGGIPMLTNIGIRKK